MDDMEGITLVRFQVTGIHGNNDECVRCVIISCVSVQQTCPTYARMEKKNIKTMRVS